MLLLALVALSGCSGSGGTTLFTEEEEVVVVENGVSGEEFGFLVEGTVCVKQLHGGCVPYDSRRFSSDIMGLHFMYPMDWVNVAASETQLEFAPSDISGETDPTKIFVWREVSPMIETYQAVNSTIVDAGTGVVGDYAVRWEIYEGTWKDHPVQAEWVTLTLDEDNPWINMTFLLLTEPDHFMADQTVLKGMVSSIRDDQVPVPETPTPATEDSIS